MCFRGMYCSSKIKVPLNIVNYFIIDLNFCCNHKTIKKFIFFKQTSAYINIETLSNILDQKFNSLLKNFFFFCDLKPSFEKFHEIIQGILIHRINDTEITDNKINNAASFSNRSVLLSGFINFLTCNFCHFNTFIYCL
jgi:hypothetical protein